MSLYSKKLEIIESILKVEEESVLYKVKEVIKKSSLQKTKSASFVTLSEDELVRLLEESEDDFKNGRVISHSEMKKEIKSWGKKKR